MADKFFWLILIFGQLTYKQPLMPSSLFVFRFTSIILGVDIQPDNLDQSNPNYKGWVGLD